MFVIQRADLLLRRIARKTAFGRFATHWLRHALRLVELAIPRAYLILTRIERKTRVGRAVVHWLRRALRVSQFVSPRAYSMLRRVARETAVTPLRQGLHGPSPSTVAAAASLIKEFGDSDADLARLAHQSLDALPIAPELPTALAQAWRSLYLTLEFVPRTLLIVPSLDDERIRRHLVCVCSHAAASRDPSTLLVVAADEVHASTGVYLPSGTIWRSLAEFRTDLDFDQKVAVLIALIHSLRPQSVLVLDSPAGWEVFARYGAAMCQYTGLFAGLVSPANEKIRGPDETDVKRCLWRCLHLLAAVYVDSAEWLTELPAGIALQPDLQQKFHLLPTDASDADWLSVLSQEPGFLSMKKASPPSTAAIPDITAVLLVPKEGFPAFPSLQSMVTAQEEAAAAGIQVEILIAADGQHSETREYLKAGSRHGARIVDLTVGDPGTARNAAVAHGRGRFFAFLDGHDLWCRDWLRKAYLCATAAPELAVWHPEANLYFGPGATPFWMLHHDIERAEADWVLLALRNHWTSLSFAPRAVYDQVPYSKTSKPGFGYEDWHWNAETVSHGFPHRTVPGTFHLIRKRKYSLAQGDARTALMTPSSLFRRRLEQPRVTGKPPCGIQEHQICNSRI